MTPTWLPHAGEAFLDTRGQHRSMRLSWHEDDGLVVLSLWRGGLCTGTFRLAIDEVPALIEVLRQGLDDRYRDAAVPGPEHAEPAAG